MASNNNSIKDSTEEMVFNDHQENFHRGGESDGKNQSIVQRFSHLPIHTASFNLLISFLLRQFGFYTDEKNKNKFSSLAEWSQESLPKVIEKRKDFLELFDDIMKHPASMAGIVLEISQQWKYPKNRDEKPSLIGYCAWYKERIMDRRINPDTLTLFHGRCNSLLNQITIRIQLIIKDIESQVGEKGKKFDPTFDLSVIDRLKEMETFFKNLYHEADRFKEYFHLPSERRETQYSPPESPNSRHSSRRDPPGAPVKPQQHTHVRSMHPRKLDFANTNDQEPVVDMDTSQSKSFPVVTYSAEEWPKLPKKDAQSAQQQKKESVPSAQQQKKESVPSTQQKKEPVPSAQQKKESVPSVQEKKESVQSVQEKKESVPPAQEKKESVPSVQEKKESMPSVQEKKEPIPTEQATPQIQICARSPFEGRSLSEFVRYPWLQLAENGLFTVVYALVLKSDIEKIDKFCN